MLQAPAYTDIENVTIFSDDTLFYKFYPIAPAPSIRLDKNGKPVFLLVKYALSDEDRQNNPSLDFGGGYLNFDIQFDVPPNLLEKVRKQLQADVDARWQRYKNGTPEEQALPGVVGASEPPKVEFGMPTWTNGKVALDAPQAENLVSARVTEGEPSLLSGNIAVFNMDLTSAGATFMEKTLSAPDGQGASDLTPIQVKYDLMFWARLPDVRIHIKADSEKIHQYTRKIMDGRGVDWCTTYDFEHTDITDESIQMSGAMEVQIDTGSGSLPEEVIAELRQYSLELVKQMIASTFFTDQPDSQQEGSEVPEIDGGDNTKKYLKKDFDQATMCIEFDLEQRSVVEWTIHPRTTLETFFHGMSPEEIKQYVRSFELDDDFYKNLTLTVRALSTFEDPEVSSVEVQVHYEGTDENGDRKEKNETFTFTDSTPQNWSVSLIGSQRQYQYRYRIGYRGQEAGPYTAWAASKSPDLNIPVVDPGRIKLNVVAGNIDFEELISQVQVHLAYEDAELGVGREEAVLTLTPTRKEQYYERLIYQPKRKLIEYCITYVMKSGEVRSENKWQEFSGPQLLINQPFTDILRVSLLPTGDGWDDIVQVHVNMKYEDLGNQYKVEEPVLLRNREEFKTWKVYLKNKDLLSYQYEWMVSYKNGGFERSGWKSGLGSDTLPIPVVRQGIKVLILPDTLDLAAAPQTEVSFHYNAAGVAETETFAFRDKNPQSWYIEAPRGAPVEFTYQVTHYPAGGDPITLPEVLEKDTVVILPAYRAPKAGQLKVEVLGMLVDFKDTPIVAVDLTYDDDLHGVHEIGARTLTAVNSTTSWEIAVKDVNQRRFGWQVTYFTPDGTEHPQPMKYQESPRIVIPKYTPG